MVNAMARAATIAIEHVYAIAFALCAGLSIWAACNGYWYRMILFGLLAGMSLALVWGKFQNPRPRYRQ
jgi:hypothetical protein